MHGAEETLRDVSELLSLLIGTAAGTKSGTSRSQRW